MNKNLEAVKQYLVDRIARAGAELCEIMGAGATVLPVTGEDKLYVAVGTREGIARVAGSPLAAVEQPSVLTMLRILEIAQHEIVAEFHSQDALNFARAIEHEVLATQSAKQGAQPCAWMHEDGRVVTAATMDGARKDGGAIMSSLRGYTLPLYAAPSLPTKAQENRAAIRNAALGEAVEAVPGGSICDPQHIADAIRALMSSEVGVQQEGAQPDDVRNHALEEAAKCVDTFVSEQLHPERMECGRDIATAIRSIKTTASASNEQGGAA